jgi:hypothetical protein
MHRLGCLFVVASTLALSVGHVRADTIDVFDASGTFINQFNSSTGSFSGTVTIDVTTGVVTGADLLFPGNVTLNSVLTFNQGLELINGQAGWRVFATDAQQHHASFDIFANPAVNTATPLVDFTGGTIGTSLLNFAGLCDPSYCNDQLKGTLTAEGVSTTPLPGALPLFAAGLGAMALLRWRRKQRPVV